MILLEPGNRILGETVAAQLVKDENEEKKSNLDIKLCDFDDVAYRILVENGDNIKVSMSLPCYSVIKDFGAKAALEKAFGSLLAEQALDNFDVTVQMSASNLGKPVDEVVKTIQMMKPIAVGGVFDYFFSELQAGRKPAPFRFKLRQDTEIFLVPSADRVAIIYELSFQDRVDRAIARIMLQEFVDARRTLGAAPPVQYNMNPPMELKDSFGLVDPSQGLGYIGFSVMKSHLDGGRKDKVVAVLQNFRSYMQYHIKCSKSFFHSRMRARVNSMLTLLNRCKADRLPTADAVKKTISGKTFTRK